MLFEYLEGARSDRYESSKVYMLDDRLERMLYEMHELRSTLRGSSSDSELKEQLSELRSALEQKRPSGPEFNDQEKRALIDGIRQRINATLSDDFLGLLDARYGSAAVKMSRFQGVVGDIELLRQRLFQEVKALQRRAALNLAIGSSTTVFAMAALAYLVLRLTPDFHSSASVLSYYFPRVTFVIFIEVFAFFFLRLYKVSLDDTKFYQNELTNVESRAIALRAALIDERPAEIGNILGELATTERNFVLKKGETTVEIERRKLDVGEGRAILEQVTNMIDKFKPK